MRSMNLHSIDRRSFLQGVGVALAWNAERESEAVRIALGIAEAAWPVRRR